jgi:hypothetical protein
MHWTQRVEAIQAKAAKVKLTSEQWLDLAIEAQEVALEIGPPGSGRLYQMAERYFKYAVVMERKGQ